MTLGPLYFTLWFKGCDHEIVRVLETHLKTAMKIEIEFCVVTGLQVECKDTIHKWALDQTYFQYNPIHEGPSTNQLEWIKGCEILKRCSLLVLY
jgi:hypothetical protein